MYVHLYINNKLITAFEYETSFYGELTATIDLIAYEHNVDPKDIKIEIKKKEFLTMNKTTELYNFIKINLVETGFITIESLDQECNINGFNMNTLEDLLFYHTSWRDLDQAQEALDAGEFYSNM